MQNYENVTPPVLTVQLIIMTIINATSPTLYG
jgi:hypothetical protein